MDRGGAYEARPRTAGARGPRLPSAAHDNPCWTPNEPRKERR
ncbi:hypothetical protein YW7DRAFT_01788 [Streptomyces sp. AmelKG-E11A]|nr:hypothetical protein YW7DRAFT_01788 [Streptomyces sp. AmelKG-E11A]